MRSYLIVFRAHDSIEEKLERDIEKTVALESAGWTVIRVREAPLVRTRPKDLVGWSGEGKRTADVLVRHLAMLPGWTASAESVEEYLGRGALQNRGAAETELTALRSQAAAQAARKAAQSGVVGVPAPAGCPVVGDGEQLVFDLSA